MAQTPTAASIKLSKRTISALQKVIAGNTTEEGKAISPYRSGPNLVDFFNELGFNDTYSWSGGFPSRWSYVESCLSQLDDSPLIIKAVEATVDPAYFVGTEFDVHIAVAYLNQFLDFDGLRLISAGKRFRLVHTNDHLISFEATLKPVERTMHEFIEEQIAKCDQKLQNGDYDGAITNARSLVEAVLFDLESRLDDQQLPYDGDLPKLYRRVQKLMNLDPAREDISQNLKQVLSGLINVVAGLAPLRNKMGDAHVREYKPSRHHAKLAVNAAKTIADFLFDTFEYQKQTGRIIEK
jgi:hypothetical protein